MARVLVCLVLLNLLTCVNRCSGETVYKNPKWTDICPEDRCQEISLSKSKKVTDTFYLATKQSKIFCTKPIVKHSIKGLKHIWYHYHVSIATNSTRASTLISANSTSFVLRKMQAEETSSGGLWSSAIAMSETVQNVTHSSPFATQCTGVKLLKHEKNGGKISVVFTYTFGPLYPILLIVGFLLFRSAGYLTKNSTFYYTSGITIGIVASLLILLYIFSKFVPKKNLIGLGVLFGGYSFAGYIGYWVYSQGIEFVSENWVSLLVYVIIAGLVSFAVLYRIGPAHPRTLQLIQWFLQLLALIFVFCSFHQIASVGIAVALALLIWYNMPASVSLRIKTMFYRRLFFLRPFYKKEKRKFLTVEEYEEQGRVETEKALKDLRKLCRSDSDFWENKLGNLQKQTKFLEFMSGKDHVTDHERDEHEDEFPLLYDDDDNDSEDSSIPSPYVSSREATFSTTPSPPRQYYY